MNSNYPPGADHDPNAPWNQKDDEPIKDFDADDLRINCLYGFIPDIGPKFAVLYIDRDPPYFLFTIGKNGQDFKLIREEVEQYIRN